MLCESATLRGSSGADLSLLKRDGWSYELKLDGVRILAHKDGAGVRLVYRSGRDATSAYAEIARDVAALPPARAVLDGEIVAFDARGRPSFERLQHRIGIGRKRASRGEVPVAFVVFDVLSLEGRDVTALPLRERRAILAGLVPDRGAVRTLDHLEGDGRPLFELCKKQGLEGVVAKRDDAPYLPGERSPAWIKIKAERSDEFVVVGTTRGRGGGIGAIDLASYRDGRLVTCGKVGSGVGESASRDLSARLAPLATDACAAEGPLEPAPLGRTFVRPEVVVSVRFHSWTEDGRLRQPVYRGVRDDLAPEDCTARPDDAADARDREALGYYEAVAGVVLPYVRGSVRTRKALLARVAAGETAFDLDAVPCVAFAARDAATACALRARLDALGLPSFAKTATYGFDVIAPVGKGARPDARAALGQLVARLVPGATLHARVAAPYTILGDGRRVSTPLAWDALDGADARSLTTRTVPERIARAGDPMSGLLTARVSLARAARELEKILF
jgi:bifunctional non-homologous end joining protein LigD